MAYCTQEYVGTLMQQTFDSTSTPKSTDVSDIIDQITAEIDLSLGMNNITVPVTNANKLLVLKRICGMGSAAMVEMSWNKNYETLSARVIKWLELYEKFLAKPSRYLGDDKDNIISSDVLDGYNTDETVASEVDYFDIKNISI